MKIHVQFADETEEVIVSCFLSQPDPEYWHYLGEVEVTDPRWHVYYEAMPVHAKQCWPSPQ